MYVATHIVTEIQHAAMLLEAQGGFAMALSDQSDVNAILNDSILDFIVHFIT